MRYPAPWSIRYIDVSRGVRGLDADDDRRPVFVVFVWKNLPLGIRAFAPHELPLPAGVVADIAAEFMAQVLATRTEDDGTSARLVEDKLRVRPPILQPSFSPTSPVRLLDRLASVEPAGAERLSVVVCTRDRALALERSLAALARQRQSPREIIVVDNAQAPDTSIADMVQSTPVARYVHEARPGLSIARNSGIRESTGELVAFTDDDTEADPAWTGEIVHAFRHREVQAVTGLVLPKSLKTDAQVLFQVILGGFGTETVPILFDSEFLKASHRSAPPVWRIGAGANMAFRRTVFESFGLFDERLGAGAAGCSEDSEMWYRILANGGQCLYEPRALMVHHHRESMSELRSQVRAYMRGHTAALVAQYDRYGHRGNLRRIFIQIPKHFALNLLVEPIKGRRDRLVVVRSEILGWAAGVGYLAQIGWRRNKDVPPMDAGKTHIRDVAGAKADLPNFLARNPFPGRLTDGLFYREKMRAIHKLAPDSGVETILEVGGGRSGLTALLYPNSRVTSLDIAPPKRRELPAEARQLQVGGKAEQLPFADETFDIVTLFDVVEHVDDDKSVVAEAMRVLRPGGSILLSTPNDNWRFPYHKVMRGLCPDEREIMSDWGHVRRGYSLDELVALIGDGPERTASFINPLTALAHDISFSRLRRRMRLVLHLVASPLTIAGYVFADRFSKGTETVARWRKAGG